MHSLEQFVDGKGRFHGAATDSVALGASFPMFTWGGHHGNETSSQTRGLHVCKLETDSCPVILRYQMCVTLHILRLDNLIDSAVERKYTDVFGLGPNQYMFAWARLVVHLACGCVKRGLTADTLRASARRAALCVPRPQVAPLCGRSIRWLSAGSSPC